MSTLLELHPDKVRVEADGCWTWTAGKTDGYGRVRYLGRKWLSHRLAFLLAEGYTPPRPLVLDHLCRNRACCNPDHLELQTPSENTVAQNHYYRNKSECPKGHPYDGDNLIIRADGKRRCRTCDRARKRKA